MELINKDFTIISNNCWGWSIYQLFNLKFQTPFIGTALTAPDYMELLRNFYDIIYNDLVFITREESRYKSFFYPCPIAKLSENVEIFFVHYKSDEEAREKWNNRIKRINPNNILFKFGFERYCTDDLIREFDKLEFKNKICFTSKNYPECNHTINLNELNGKNEVYFADEINYYRNHVDIIKVLNSLKN